MPRPLKLSPKRRTGQPAVRGGDAARPVLKPRGSESRASVCRFGENRLGRLRARSRTGLEQVVTHADGSDGPKRQVGTSGLSKCESSGGSGNPRPDLLPATGVLCHVAVNERRSCCRPAAAVRSMPLVVGRGVAVAVGATSGLLNYVLTAASRAIRSGASRAAEANRIGAGKSNYIEAPNERPGPAGPGAQRRIQRRGTKAVEAGHAVRSRSWRSSSRSRPASRQQAQAIINSINGRGDRRDGLV